MQLRHGDPHLLRPDPPRPLRSLALPFPPPFLLLPLAVVAGSETGSSNGAGIGLRGSGVGGEDLDDPFIPDFSVVGLAPHVDDEVGGGGGIDGRLLS